MLRRLYHWTLSLAQSPHAIWAMAAVAFVESSFFPIPPDILLIPMIIAAPTRWWRVALVCTVASVLGGALGYWIGAALFETVGQPMLDFYGKGGQIEDFRAKYDQWGAWAVFIAGVTPFPYKVITIASGALSLDFATFMVASVLARGLRFFVVAFLLWKFGAPIRDFIDRRLGLVSVAFVAILLGGFVAIKYLV